jgi:hypothetical protein
MPDVVERLKAAAIMGSSKTVHNMAANKLLDNALLEGQDATAFSLLCRLANGVSGV